MSRKHHCKHPERGLSNYRLRLAARGISSAKARMELPAVLAVRQARRKEATGHPWRVVSGDDEERPAPPGKGHGPPGLS